MKNRAAVMAAGRLFEGGDRPSLRERRLLGGYLSRISRGHLVQSHCRLGITHIADEQIWLARWIWVNLRLPRQSRRSSWRNG